MTISVIGHNGKYIAETKYREYEFNFCRDSERDYRSLRNIQLNKYQLNIKRFTWYFPWEWYSWKPGLLKSCDEWHNKSFVVTIPLLGGFCWFITWNQRLGKEHIWAYIDGETLGFDDIECDICQELKEEFKS